MISITKFISMKSAARKRKSSRYRTFRPTLENLEARNLMAGDMHGAFLDVPADADWGDVVEIRGRIDQWGWGTSGEFDVQWYLSDDVTASDDDILLRRADGTGDTYRHPSLDRQSSFFTRGPELTVDLELPDALPVGWLGNDFHVIMRTDAHGEVNEWFEGNNFGERGPGRDRASLTINAPTSPLHFSDASHDATPLSVFQNGAVRFSYNFKSQGRSFDPVLPFVHVEAIQNGNVVASFGPYQGVARSSQLLNLAERNLDAGTVMFRPRAKLLSGRAVFGKPGWLNVQAGSSINGDTPGETFRYAEMEGEGVVINGGGGTDTLVIDVSSDAITALNGQALGRFAPDNGVTAQQAIYRGSAYDFLQLNDGREIYLAGIERLEFAEGRVVELLVQTNDPAFDDQWNLHTQDVPGAWRFTRGSRDVLLVSLDTGLLTPAGKAEDPFEDMTAGRLLTDATDDDNFNGSSYGHGHRAISVMSGTANNNVGIAGINWVSDVFVADVYQGVDLVDGIGAATQYAAERGQRVVFQGGIQGNWWLGGSGAWSRNELEQLFEDNHSSSLFAIAAGNFNRNLNVRGGVAAMQTTHTNVMAVGAEKHTSEIIHGLANSATVFRAAYSNFGSDLTMMAATDSPAVNKQGNVRTFTGTSAANPNMAGIASLVWSALPTATAGEIRQILVDTATDLAAPGRDDQTGAGLVNAESAVRRAVALARDAALAQLSSPAVRPGLVVVAGRFQPGLNLPLFRPPEAGTEAIAAARPAAARWTSPGVDLKHSFAMKERPNDTEFTPSPRHSAAISETDAVTAVMHELGQVRGDDDLEQSDGEHELTYAWLQPNFQKTFADAAIVDEVFAEL
ncbi:MAG: S8 family serine peptidase [Planctomycetota bacterium]|nr:S8 family serine peptidase [Planctomycetota bacterium]